MYFPRYPRLSRGYLILDRPLKNAMARNIIKNIKCPKCRKPATWEGNPFRPFCSERCRMIDLGAWVTGEYRVPGEEKMEDEEEEEE